jgi:hypothetical protein
MSKNPLLFILMFQILSCSDKKRNKAIPVKSESSSQVRQKPINELTSTEEIIPQLKNKKARIDTLMAHKELRLEVLVKEPNKGKLTLVKNEQWPEEIETTYNIWENAEGQVIVVGEYPLSESGDWDIEYLHYFDNNGKIFSFERNTNFFNSICTEGVAYESLVEFYNSDFIRINSTTSLVDEARKNLKKEDCVMNYDFPYSINKNLKEYLKKINYRS